MTLLEVGSVDEPLQLQDHVLQPGQRGVAVQQVGVVGDQSGRSQRDQVLGTGGLVPRRPAARTLVIDHTEFDDEMATGVEARGDLRQYVGGGSEHDVLHRDLDVTDPVGRLAEDLDPVGRGELRPPVVDLRAAAVQRHLVEPVVGHPTELLEAVEGVVPGHALRHGVAHGVRMAHPFALDQLVGQVLDRRTVTLYGQH